MEENSFFAPILMRCESLVDLEGFIFSLLTKNREPMKNILLLMNKVYRMAL